MFTEETKWMHLNKSYLHTGKSGVFLSCVDVTYCKCNYIINVYVSMYRSNYNCIISFQVLAVSDGGESPEIKQ